MDATTKQFQEKLIEVEIAGENILLAWQQGKEWNREALTALRKSAKTTKTSIPSPFESIMREIEPRPLVREVCSTCDNPDVNETTWLMFPGTDIFASAPFHAVHTILEQDQIRLD